MHKTAGFTLIELITTIGIISILSLIAIPNFIAWRSNSKFNAAVNILAGDLAVAKQSAIRKNAPVVVSFESDFYYVFVDDGSDGGTANNNTEDGGEDTVLKRNLPAGVSIDLTASTFSGNCARFTGRGMCDSANTGAVVVVRGSDTGSVSVNRLGRILSSFSI